MYYRYAIGLLVLTCIAVVDQGSAVNAIQVGGTTSTIDFCEGCLTKEIYGDCGQGEDYYDPCGCVEQGYGQTNGEPQCNALSIAYSGTTPREDYFQTQSEVFNDDIPVKESRICRIEYECDPQSSKFNAECGSALNCSDASVLKECRNCIRGLWKDNISMPAHRCLECP